MIENIVHQIWVGDSKKATWNMMLSWKKYCDKFGWEYKLWRENDLEKVPMKNREMYEYYKQINDYLGMSDVARIEILNRYGGIYSDCDFYNWGNYIPDLIDCEHNMLMVSTEHEYPDWNSRKYIKYVNFDGNLPMAMHLANGYLMCKKENNILSYMLDIMKQSFDINSSVYDENNNYINFNTIQKNGCYLLTHCSKKYPFVMIPMPLLFQCYWRTKNNLDMQTKVIATYIDNHERDNEII